ncbi:MAG: hypothetical protein KDA75_05190 [Planctomycetaceae bacterium]|nr:hypothetical protein [Planctomycetaceae bacterium]
MPPLLALDWNQDTLGCIEAELGGEKVRVLRTAQFPWPEAIDRSEDPAGLGSWIGQQLTAAGIESREAIVVLPREEVVTRRLELPNAPDEELPELVRFQAAAKSATPLDQLILDFVPLPQLEPEAPRPALMATLEQKRLQHFLECSAAAGLQLRSLQASPFSVAEVAIRSERQRGEDSEAATLVIFQDEHRVELSILQRLGLVFTHHTRVDPTDARALRGTLSEINRSIVTFGQLMHSSVEVARVCLIHDGEIDHALEEALSQRFSGRLHVVDPADDSAVETAGPDVAARLAGLAPAMGALLGRLERTVPSVDFLNPRRPPPPRDLRREQMIRIGTRAGAAVLLLGIAGWWYASHLDGQIADLQKEDGDLTVELKQGQPAMDAHTAIHGWQSAAVEPLGELERLNRLLPGTHRLLLLDAHVIPGREGEVARINGYGIARTEADITALWDTLTRAGYRVQPKVSLPYKNDPDYPHRFEFDVSRIPQTTTTQAKPS